MSIQQNQYMPESVFIPHFGTTEPVVGIEIGVLGGGGTLGFLLRMPNLKLYSIDPWEHRAGEEYEAGFAQEVLEANYEEARRRLVEMGDRSVLIRKRSDDALEDVPTEVDFVFIDGDHRYEQVKRDIENYRKKVRSGGIISGHDYGQAGGVTQAVDEAFVGHTVHVGEDFTWWVYL